MAGETLQNLKQTFRQEGLFEVSNTRIVLDIVAHFALFFFAYAIADKALFGSLLILTFAGINLAWWLHDAGHDAFFHSRERAKFWIEVLSVTFMGMPQLHYHFSVHRKHHGLTNVMGRDPALETGPIVWHRNMLSRSHWLLLKLQPILWFCIVIPFTQLFISVRGTLEALKEGRYLLIAALVVRWSVFIFIFKLPVLVLLHPFLISAFVGYIASLNHFHMPITERPISTFAHHIFYVTQNLSNRGPVSNWLLGGLNFHVEHHLFPTMPSKNYAKIAGRIEAYANQVGVPYHKCSFWSASSKLFYKLCNPIGGSQ